MMSYLCMFLGMFYILCFFWTIIKNQKTINILKLFIEGGFILFLIEFFSLTIMMFPISIKIYVFIMILELFGIEKLLIC